MKKIKTVGIAGAGTMGSALAQKFAQEGFSVILVDKEMRLVDNGIKRIKETLNEGIERKLFSPEQAGEIISRISGSANIEDFKKCELIIEAIFENLNSKRELFQTLDKIVSSDTVLATNTSSFSVTELSSSVSNPQRFIGMHYFYHAAKNRLVEIIPGEKTSADTVRQMKNFAVLSGKDAIECKDSYGFVVNRFFVPWLNEAVRLLEEGTALAKEIDSICMKVFSIGMGPFALMNATGVPIAYHSQRTLEKFGSLYKTSEALRRQAELNEPWEIDETNPKQVDSQIVNSVRDRMLGIVFLVCSQILDEKVCGAVEINRGARIGLRWRRGPIDLMKKFGHEETSRLIRLICDKYNVSFPSSVNEKNWEMEFVKFKKFGDAAVITISRPEDMNALNEDIMCQLDEKFDQAEKDFDIKRVFITGVGKAFVAGADIKFFIDNIKSNTLNKIVSFTAFGQKVFDKIEGSKKTVIGVINGLTLGGGLELALCCDSIIAVPKAVFAFPETGIGIYPGLGGTQRAPKRLGTGLAKYMIYTGDFLSAQQAEKIGLADGLINYEDIPDLIEGKMPLPKTRAEITDELYKSYGSFFDMYKVGEILGNENASEGPLPPIGDKLIKKIRRKAPLALRTAEKLIDEARGCESELENLTYIFSTTDALLGLSSIGKSVEFQGK